MNAPDLFIPLMGVWSYALLSCVVLAFKHSFKPESMSATVSNRGQEGVEEGRGCCYRCYSCCAGGGGGHATAQSGNLT